MYYEALKSKVNGFVTEASEEYKGSITVGKDIMEAAGLFPYEKVEVNGIARITTYVIEGEDGQICLNGNAAKHFFVGEKIHINAFRFVNDGVKVPEPLIVTCLKQINGNKIFNNIIPKK